MKNQKESPIDTLDLKNIECEINVSELVNKKKTIQLPAYRKTTDQQFSQKVIQITRLKKGRYYAVEVFIEPNYPIATVLGLYKNFIDDYFEEGKYVEATKEEFSNELLQAGQRSMEYANQLKTFQL